MFAREIAEQGHEVEVVDARDHVAGNCYTERDSDTGVMVHRYGPHLFHTRHQHVIDYVHRFARTVPTQHRVKAKTASGIYALPINLLSLNQFFGTRLGPAEMQSLIDQRREASIVQPANFEEQALSLFGIEIYEEFFAGYTQKQWGRSPAEIPASVLKRLPMRFDYNDRYFDDPFEVSFPEGITPLIEAVLDHPRIGITLSATATAADFASFDHGIWTGPLDVYFARSLGNLPYRTLDFAWSAVDAPHQGCSVMNFCEPSVEHTRTTEYGYLEPWSAFKRSIIATEVSRECGEHDIPYYPIRLADDKLLLAAYVELAEMTEGVSFLGRLGTYRYLDMDASIDAALHAASKFCASADRGEVPPTFFSDPMS